MQYTDIVIRTREVFQMANKSTVPFQGTKEQETVLREVIEKRKSEQGALMAVLQQAQEIYG